MTRFVALLGALGIVAAVMPACRGAELTRLSLGQQIVIDAEGLPELWGETPLKGEIALTFERVAIADSYDDDICGYGRVMAKGKFVAILYRVRNDAQARMQPSSQLGDEFVLVDGHGRQWQEAEYSQSRYCFLNANFANQFGGEGPEHWIDPGFEGLTAVVFDVPKDAEDFSLRHEELGFDVGLD